MKLKLDENLSSRCALVLEAAGHDVLTVGDQDLTSAADQVLINVCRSEKRCLVTLDLGFGNPLVFDPHQFHGIAVLRLPRKPSMDDLLSAARVLALALAQDDITGKLWVEQGLLSTPILYLSRFIVEHKNDYYRLLLRVTREGRWEDWLLFMLAAVEDTAVWTTGKIAAIRSLADDGGFEQWYQFENLGCLWPRASDLRRLELGKGRPSSSILLPGEKDAAARPGGDRVRVRERVGEGGERFSAAPQERPIVPGA